MITKLVDRCHKMMWFHDNLDQTKGVYTLQEMKDLISQ